VDVPLALAAFLAGCPTEFAMDRCRVLKLGNKRTRHIEFLLAHRGSLLDANMSLARLKKLLAKPYFQDLYELERAIEKAAGAKEGLTSLRRLRRRVRDLRGVDIKPKPLLTGRDLIRLGAVPGPTLGQLAEELYVAQLEGEVQAPEQAEQWAKAWLERHRSTE
jgi:poly(A) polymerase